MHILYLVEWYRPIGGIEAFVWRLVQHLEPDFKVTLAIAHMGGKGDLPPLPDSIAVHDVSRGTVPTVIRLIRELRPDVIHSNHISPIGLAGLWGARRYRIPLLLTNHQVPEYQVSWSAGVTNPLLWRYLRWFDRKATAVSAPSPTVARLLAKHGIRNRVHAISCGVDTERFQPRDRRAARTELGLPNLPTLLAVGRLASDKNLDLLVRAAANLRENRQFQVLLVGPQVVRCNVYPQLVRLIATLHLQETVHFSGALPPDSEALTRYYNAADLFVIPSHFETQSIVTLEAMASGLPVVASRSGALPDLVEDGVNGRLFTPLSAPSLAEKLNELLGNPDRAREMGKRGRELAAPHRIELVAQQYGTLYREIARVR